MLLQTIASEISKKSFDEVRRCASLLCVTASGRVSHRCAGLKVLMGDLLVCMRFSIVWALGIKEFILMAWLVLESRFMAVA